MKTGFLFENAIRQANLTLVPGVEFKIRVVGSLDRKINLVIENPKLSEFEKEILSRSQKNRAKNKPYKTKLSTGEKISILRKGAGLTIDQLAKKAKLTKGSLGSIEKGSRGAGLAVVKRIAVALKIPVSLILE